MANRLVLPLGGLAALAFALVGSGGGGTGAARPNLLGSVTWVERASDFGGLSGLALQDAGNAFFAVSDAGLLMQARLTRDKTGALAKVDLLAASRIRDNFGRPAEGFQSDAEAIRIDADGSLLVSFEGYARVARFRPPDMMPTPLNEWDRFRTLWGNEGMEALALGAGGRILTVLETPLADGDYRTLEYRGGKTWTDGPQLRSDGLFSATDADFGPDGRLYVLERNFSIVWGYQARISVYAPTDEGFAAPGILLLTNAGAWGDFEGMDVWTDAQGRTVATLIADNNFLPLSPTTIAEFDLTGKPGNPGKTDTDLTPQLAGRR